MHTQTDSAARVSQGRSLWRVATLAADCDVSERTIWRAIQAGNLETIRIGRATLVTDESRQRWLASLQQAVVA